MDYILCNKINYMSAWILNGMPLSKQIECPREFLKKLSSCEKYRIKPHKVDEYIWLLINEDLSSNNWG